MPRLYKERFLNYVDTATTFAFKFIFINFRNALRKSEIWENREYARYLNLLSLVKVMKINVLQVLIDK